MRGLVTVFAAIWETVRVLIGFLLRTARSVSFWGYGLFWSWNLIYLAFFFLGFCLIVLPQLVVGTRAGVVPLVYLVYFLILGLVPLVFVWLGGTKLAKRPAALLMIGYGVEGPLLILLLIRFFALRELNPAVTVMLAFVGLGFWALLWWVLDPKRLTRPRPWLYAGISGLTLFFLSGLYLALSLGLWILPGAIGFIDSVIRSISYIFTHLAVWPVELWQDLARMPLEMVALVPIWLMGMALFAYTATLVMGLPIVLPILGARLWWGSLARFARAGVIPLWQSLGLSLLIAIAATSTILFANRQPQAEAFSLLQSPPRTAAEATALHDKDEIIRQGLVNAYLSSFRYIGVGNGASYLTGSYQSTLGLSDEASHVVQSVFESVIGPLLYIPVRTGGAFSTEAEEAARLYASYFDRPINRAEIEPILRAIRSNWSASEIENAWRAVDDREIRLKSQEVTISEQGDWAEVELFESYQNRTGSRSEVVYYFSLPESAVLTGVYLNTSPDRENRAVFRVSPRGSAQQAYRNEVVQNVDPALLEEIGPRQYRLRIFPIEPMRLIASRPNTLPEIQEAPQMYMWLNYSVMRSDGGWALPRLAEKRNVYWDDQSVRLIGDQPTSARAEEWLPANEKAQTTAPAQAHRFDLGGGQSVLALPAGSVESAALSDSLRLAVIVDRSLGMSERKAEVQAALGWLRSLPSGQSVDLYLSASPYSGEEPSRLTLSAFGADAEARALNFTGGLHPARLLNQFSALRNGDSYDAVIVLTDDSGYELGASPEPLAAIDSPLWLVHLGDRLPIGYDDATLEAIQKSGGGVAASLTEALQRFALADRAGEVGSTDLVDGYYWSVVPTADAATKAPTAGASEESFGALAARRAILAETHRLAVEGNGDLRLASLDRLHALAKAQGVVTPYSSMIVLVNERQEKMLDQLESQSDRFEREHEEIGQTVPTNVTGVPEPEEWLLLICGAAIVYYVARKRRVQIASGGASGQAA